jgi:hypothetical protein
MILANKNGDLSLVEVVRKTRSGTHVRNACSTSTYFVSKKDKNRLLVDSAEAGIEFVMAK